MTDSPTDATTIETHTSTTTTVDPAPVLHAPGAPTTDFLWRCVVLTCCFLIAVSGTALVLGMFVSWRGFVAVELVQGVFLVVFGFIAGLLAPSPSRR